MFLCLSVVLEKQGEISFAKDKAEAGGGDYCQPAVSTLGLDSCGEKQSPLGAERAGSHPGSPPAAVNVAGRVVT